MSLLALPLNMPDEVVYQACAQLGQCSGIIPFGRRSVQRLSCMQSHQRVIWALDAVSSTILLALQERGPSWRCLELQVALRNLCYIRPVVLGQNKERFIEELSRSWQEGTTTARKQLGTHCR